MPEKMISMMVINLIKIIFVIIINNNNIIINLKEINM